MSLRSTICRAWFSQRLKAIDRFRRHPAETQERMFRQLVDRGLGTAFGKRYGLSAARTPAHFCALVPVFDYDSFKPWIERMVAGERNVAAPGRVGGRSLTDVLLDTLAEFGARGTFDVIGDTSENYPDAAGKAGSAAWGGVKFDHYPDIGKDGQGGAAHCERLIRRMLDEGHQITNHGYRHIIFGKKPFVYGAREYLGGVDKAADDLRRFRERTELEKALLQQRVDEKVGFDETVAQMQEILN